MAVDTSQATTQQQTLAQASGAATNATQAAQPTEIDGIGDNEDAEDSDEDYDSQDEDYDSDAESVDSIEAEIDRRSQLWVMKDGEQRFINENPWTEDAWEKFDPYDKRYLYRDLTAPELRDCIRARGLVDPYPQGLTLRYYYIRILHCADKAATFRFMDLPPEMRLMICTELLFIGEVCCRKDTFCYPEILRTCKQVHEEANDILYAVNEINCAFTALHHEGHDLCVQAHCYIHDFSGLALAD